MIKSPWKLLTGMLSRRKTEDQDDVGQSNVPEGLKEVEGPGTNPTGAHASISDRPTPELGSSAALQAGNKDGDFQAQTTSTVAEAPDLVIRRAERRKPRGQAASTTRRRAKTEATVRTSAAKAVIALAGQVAPSELDPVRAVERDVRELRSQLSQKLRLQNDQLRQMLKRFEPK